MKTCLLLVASVLLVAMPFAPSSVLAPSSVYGPLQLLGLLGDLLHTYVKVAGTSRAICAPTQSIAFVIVSVMGQLEQS